MVAALELLDAEGEVLDLDAPVEFGTVTTSTTSEPRQLKLRNAGDADVYFARIRAVAHPKGQVGSAGDTVAATQFAATQDGAYAKELELGTLEPGEERAFWVRWVVPAEAMPGAAAWAVEALASVT